MLTTARPVVASDPPAAEKTPAKKKHEATVKVGGYLRPGFGFRYLPAALPKDVFDYGFFGRSGLEVEAHPFEMWRAKLHLQLSSEALTAVTDLELFDLNGNGVPDGVAYTTSALPGAVLEEATVSFVPSPMIQLLLGSMRIPFSLTQQSANTALMFPTRAAVNEVFLSGADLGFSARSNFLDGIILANLGVFNGDSLGLWSADTVTRGVVIAARADLNPFGAFAFGEGDHSRGPFRLGLGFGTMIRPATIYDERTGTEPRSVFDLRISASLRMAYRGLYFAGEYFRRQQTDDFSSRPEVADGAYGQLAFFFRALPFLALEPIVRVGFVAEDQTFDPRFIGYTSAGFNLFPAADADPADDVKITLQYLGERRFTEDEDAHGGALAVQLKF